MSREAPRQLNSKTGSRNWTANQILFVLDRLSNKSNAEITDEYNSFFAGAASIEKNQVKYIRMSYGKDPNWVAPEILGGQVQARPAVDISGRLGQNVDRCGPQINQVAVGLEGATATTTAGGLKGATATTTANNRAFAEIARTGNPSSIGAHTRTSASRQPPPTAQDQGIRNLPARQAQHSSHLHQADGIASESTGRESAPTPFVTHTLLGVAGMWFDGHHGDCPLAGQHRHDVDGGVYFASMAALQYTMRRTRVYVTLDQLGDIMERQPLGNGAGTAGAQPSAPRRNTHLRPVDQPRDRIYSLASSFFPISRWERNIERKIVSKGDKVRKELERRILHFVRAHFGIRKPSPDQLVELAAQGEQEAEAED